MYHTVSPSTSPRAEGGSSALDLAGCALVGSARCDQPSTYELKQTDGQTTDRQTETMEFYLKIYHMVSPSTNPMAAAAR